MVSALRECANTGQLKRITNKDEVNRTLDQLMQKEWVIYAKSCLNHTENVIAYLARYTHRIAISDQRITHLENDQVSFEYKDYRDEQSKTLTLNSEEFIRRFLMHVLPKGLMRIRHYGFLANRCRQAALKTIRQILASPAPTSEKQNNDLVLEYPCPKCHKGHLVPIRELSPVWPVPPLIGSG